ncbi:MAG: LytTR family DNA-binding domain-containing protein [Chloroflexota bacterium]
MHILIADDEKPARGELRYILEQLDETAVFHEAKTGREALAVLEREGIDVVFLDINMPDLTGIMVAAALVENPALWKDGRSPIIVFATAYNTYAVRAFELAALDYIVKPYNEQRLAQTMVRVRQALSEQTEREEKQTALQNYVQSATPQITKMWGEQENKTSVLVDYQDILWFEAEGKKVYMKTAVVTKNDPKLQVRYTIKELETRLAPHSFVRVHKGYMVNLNHVAEVSPWFSGTYILRMTDEERTEIPMSRQYGKQLKELTGSF